MRAAAISLVLILTGCSSAPEAPKETLPSKPAPTPVTDESRRFPSKDLVKATIATGHALDKEYLPAGNVAEYRKSKVDFKAFLVQTDSPTAAAILLGDVRKKLTDPKLVPSFGGFFGADGGVPLFVFAKGKWLAGVQGLSQADADAFSREFAARIN